MNYLTKEQYIKKSQIYRTMKNNILEMKLIIKNARNAGQKDIESIKLIEDTVRVDTSLVFKKIQNMIKRDDMLTTSRIISSQKSIEQNLFKIKENSNNFRKSIRKTFTKNKTDPFPVK